MDDILLSGRNDAEHLKNLTEVLQILLANGLQLKRKKCVFMAPEVTYLGFCINQEGVSPVDEKIKPILEAPVPQNVTQLKSFLGMLNYYHRHIPNMADISEPLHCLLQKNCTWNWSERQEKAFKKQKNFSLLQLFLYTMTQINRYFCHVMLHRMALEQYWLIAIACLMDLNDQ